MRIGEVDVGRTLCDLGENIYLMMLLVLKLLGLKAPRPTIVMLQLADRSLAYPKGVIKYVLLHV